MLFFTSNMLTTETDNVLSSEILDSLNMQTWAGRDTLNSFRIGYTGDGDITATLFSDDVNILLSFDDFREFEPTLDIDLSSGEVSQTIYVKLTAPVDAIEVTNKAAIVVAHDALEYVPTAEKILTVDYFLAASNTGESKIAAIDRLSGARTLQVSNQIEQQGEALVLTKWTPYRKPNGAQKEDLIYPYREDDAKSIFESAQWTNVNNGLTGFTSDIFHSKGFIGDRSLQHTQELFDHLELSLDSSDVQRIILPAEFEGFQPKPNSKRVIWSLTNDMLLFQHTVFTIKHKGVEYHLANIQEVTFMLGELLMWQADLHRVEYPHASSTSNKLPWNILYDERQKQAGYVDDFSTKVIDHDPYCPIDEYGCLHNPFIDLSTLIFDEDTKGIVFANWWTNR